MDLIKAERKNEDLLASINSFREEPEGFQLWWLGQSGYLLQWKGKRLLIDPYLSDSLTKKYLTTDKPHTRLSELVIAPELLTGINIVTSSHNHTDHLDAETLVPVLRNNPGIKFIIPEANRAFVADRVGCDPGYPVGLNEKESVEIEGFRITGVPARHNEVDRDEKGHCRYMGYVFEFDGYALYHSGDTLWLEDIIQQVRPFAVDLALLPINGNRPERKVAGNLDTKEAAEFGKALGAKVVIPCHYDMFFFNTAEVGDFVREAELLGQGYKVLAAGGFFTFKK